MKKIFLLLLPMITLCANTYCAQSSKKKVCNVVTDSTIIIMDRAKAGDAAAQNMVGRWYYYGKDSIKIDYNWALQWWSRSAKQEYPEAIANMAMCYQFGRGTKQDSTMAVNLYKKAIMKECLDVIPFHEKLAKDEKNVFSCMFLRECYLKGVGVKKDFKRATYYQELAAEGGHESSQFAIGLNFLNNKQADKAAGWFKKAADQGNVNAIYYYGYLLLNGMGITQNKKEGINYLNRATEIGFPTADYQLGMIYFEGNGVDKDKVKAFEYVKRAAYHGNAEAKWMLGIMYLKGEGTSIDYFMASQWLAEVALTTHQTQFENLLADDNEGVYTQYLMGLRKYYVDKDFNAAISYFNKVDKAKIPEGKTMIGLCYANKDFEKQNLNKAIKALTKAAEAGSSNALYHLSGMYETGTGVNKDMEKAIELLQKAAEAGIARAECRLGDHYMIGNGVPKDLSKAVQLYLSAESQNQLSPHSAKNLIECYRSKIASLPDLDKADKRIDDLMKIKVNNNFVNLLGRLEK